MVRPQRSDSLPLVISLMSLFFCVALFPACSGDSGGDSGVSNACPDEADIQACPNEGTEGTGVDGEPCSTKDDCMCGLACLESQCTPYTGDFACCACEAATSTDDSTGTTDDETGTGTDDGPDLDDCEKFAPVGADCNPYCQIGCEEDEHCTYNSGDIECTLVGTGAIGDACSGSNQCSEGHACIKLGSDPADSTGVCRRFCITDTDCPDDRKCNMTVNFGGGLEAQICSEVVVGCNPFEIPSTVCEACQVEATCDGYVAPVTGADGIMGACSEGGVTECAGVQDCEEDVAECEGYVAPADAVLEVLGTCSNDGTTECSDAGACGGTAATCDGYAAAVVAVEEVMGACSEDAAACSADEDCAGMDATCDGYVDAVEGSDEVMGSCSEDAAECSEDSQCASAGASCDGYVAPQDLIAEVLGACSEGGAECSPEGGCIDNPVTCDGYVAGEATVDEVMGTCSVDGAGCTSDLECLGCPGEESEACYFASNATKCAPAGTGIIGDVCDQQTAQCAPGLQCLVVCQEICSTDDTSSDTPKCSACPSGEMQSINDENSIGICLTNDIPAECDIFAQTGCAAGEGCYSATGGHACFPAGSGVPGSECSSGTDCQAGSICIGSLCLPVCSEAPDADPSVKCGETWCSSSLGLLPNAWQQGFCTNVEPEMPCKFWDQGCGAGKVCYPTYIGEACLAPQGQSDVGASCNSNQDCQQGLVCPNASNQCAEPCSILEFPDAADPSTVPICVDDCPGGTFDPIQSGSAIGTCI